MLRVPITRSPLSFLLLACIGLLVSCSSSSNIVPTSVSPVTPASSSLWAVAWGAIPENAIKNAENAGGSEQSFRFLLLPTIDGTEERVRFSNRFGTTPITIGAARLAVAASSTPVAPPAIDPSRDTALTFSGASTVTIQPGQEIISDTVHLTYTFGQKLAVSMYLPGGYPPLTQHESQVGINYASATNAGNTTTDASGSSFAQAITEWFLLSGVDVYGSYQGTVALFGSSSIDGHGSNYGNTVLYPAVNPVIPSQDNDRPSDWLARYLVAAGYRLGVLNAGTIGNPASEDNLTAIGQTIAAVDRIGKDVLQQPGIKAVVIYTGGVDLRTDCGSAAGIETSITSMVAQSYAAHVRVILGTVPPSEYCTTSSADLLPSAANPYQGDLYPGPENPGSTQRRALNDWIRSTGAQLPGVVAIADFDAALRYPLHPDFYQPSFATNDNYHPNGVGYGVQSAAIPLNAILGAGSR